MGGLNSFWQRSVNGQRGRSPEGKRTNPERYAFGRETESCLKAYLAELAAMQGTEHPSEAVIAMRFREYFRNRFIEATAVLSRNSSRLAEALIEILELIAGESEIVGWRPLALGKARGERSLSYPLRAAKTALWRV
jgi:hypothetical protein